MSRSLAVCLSLLLVAAADGSPPAGSLPHASGAPAGPGRGCGGGFTAARGDTLYSIARRCETSVIELVQENRLGQPPRLAAGQALIIPGFADERRVRQRVPVAAAAPPRPPEAAPPRPARPLLPSPLLRTRPDRSGPSPPPRPAERVEVRRVDNVYVFQAGDTFYSLARWARTSVAALQAANPGRDPRSIDAGTIIALPPGAMRPEPMRLRERGRPAPMRTMAPPPPPPAAASLPTPPPAAALPPRPPRPPVTRPAQPPDDDPDKSKPDDDEVTPGGMDDDGPQPDGMF